MKLAQLTKKCGVDGVVASVQEAKAIRKACGREFLIVTPGVRPAAEIRRQRKKTIKHVPRRLPQAIKAGADYIVVGRPIIAADDPRAATRAIVEEIAAAK